MGPAVAFVGAIFFGVGAGASLAYTIAVGLARLALLSLASKALTPKIDLSQAAADKLLTVKSTVQPQAFVYGQDMLSGPLMWGQVEGGDKLHRLVALTGREIDSFVGFRIDDTDIDIPGHIPDASDTVTAGTFADVLDIDTRTGTTTQTAIAALSSAFPSLWTSAHRARGWSLFYTKFTVEGASDAFASGIPQNLRALVKGHKVYDPRLDTTQIIDDTTSPVTMGSGAHRVATPSTWAWSDNPALCLADWLIWEQVGMGESTARVDYEMVAKAAAICDQLVSIPPVASPDTTQRRYTCNFTFYGNQARGSVKSILEQAMLGRCIYSQGKWRMFAGAALTSSVTLTEANLGGDDEPVAIEAATGSRDRYNRVRGKFIDPSRNYSANPYPEQRSALDEAADGEVIYQTVDFSACNNSFEAQRNAIIVRRQSRNQKVLKFPGNWSCFRIQAGHVVELNMAELGWSATASPTSTQKFFVSGWELRQDGSGVTLTLVEEIDAAWTDPDVTDYTTRSPTGELVPPARAEVQISNATIHNRRSTIPIYAGIKLEASGRVKYSNAANVYSDALVPIGDWLLSGTREYLVRATVLSGSLTTGTIDTWLSLDSDRFWDVQVGTDSPATDDDNQAVIRLDLTADDTTSPVSILDTADITLWAGFPEISIRDIGTTLEVSGVSGQSATAVPKPARVSGDTLIVMTSGFAGGYAPAGAGELANWTEMPNMSGSGIRGWYRQASGDSDDDWTLQAFDPNEPGSMAFAQMMSVRTDAGSTLAVSQEGPQVAASVTPFNITELPASTDDEPTLVIGYYVKYTEWIGETTTPTMTPASTLTEIGSYVVREVINQPTYLWTGWGYAIVGNGSIDAASITYAPSDVIPTRSQYIRFSLV